MLVYRQLELREPCNRGDASLCPLKPKAWTFHLVLVIGQYLVPGCTKHQDFAVFLCFAWQLLE